MIDKADKQRPSKPKVRADQVDTPSTSAFVDKEIYRKVENDYYSPYIRADSNGTITICVGGQCIFMPIEKWHDTAMETVEPFNRREIDRINTLKRRISMLEERINTDPRDLSYDKAEAKALRWIISLAEGNDLVDLRRIDAEKRIQNPQSQSSTKSEEE